MNELKGLFNKAIENQRDLIGAEQILNQILYRPFRAQCASNVRLYEIGR